MRLLDRLLGRQPAVAETAVAISEASTSQPVSISYRGCEISIIPPQEPGGAITIERVTQGRAAQETFWALFQALHSRMDLGLREDTKNHGVALGRHNLVSGNSDKMWVRGTVATIQHAIQILAAEKTVVVSDRANAQVSFNARNVDNVATHKPKADRPPKKSKPTSREQQKPEPSVDEVIRVLKQHHKVDDGTIDRFKAVLTVAVAAGKAPHEVVDDTKALRQGPHSHDPGKFKTAEIKKFRDAIDVVYGQRGAAR